MSYTFLPYSEQKHIRREYRVRVLIVLFFFIAISLVIGVASLFPAYIYSILEERNHLSQVAAFKKTIDASTITATQQQLLQGTTVLNLVSNTIQPNIFYTTAISIVSLRGNVIINSFTFDHTSSNSMIVILSGIAPTRNDLLSFKTRLEGLPDKTLVDLPISTLAQDTNVSFSIQITETLK